MFRYHHPNDALEPPCDTPYDGMHGPCTARVGDDMPVDFFSEAFIDPLFRLRMTHYPSVEADIDNPFGIAPHVDTSFFTILAQDKPGLTVFSERRKVWVKAPVVKNSFIVNCIQK